MKSGFLRHTSTWRSMKKITSPIGDATVNIETSRLRIDVVDEIRDEVPLDICLQVDGFQRSRRLKHLVVPPPISGGVCRNEGLGLRKGKLAAGI